MRDIVANAGVAVAGARVLLLDWDNAGANDPFNDLAAVAVFLRMDDATCAQLIAAHDGSEGASMDRALRELAAASGLLVPERDGAPPPA